MGARRALPRTETSEASVVLGIEANEGIVRSGRVRAVNVKAVYAESRARQEAYVYTKATLNIQDIISR